MDTEVLLSEDLKLNLTTYRNVDGYLVTYATVSRKMLGHSDPFLYGHRLGQDYNRVFKATKCRVTKKAVLEQHAEYLKDIFNIVEDAKKYYSYTVVK